MGILNKRNFGEEQYKIYRAFCEDMFEKMKTFGKSRDDVGACYIIGSMANIEQGVDAFSDFDVVYAVKDIKPFLKNKKWLTQFGDVMIIEAKSACDSRMATKENVYSFPVQYREGHRIDFKFQTYENLNKVGFLDKNYKILFDKDGLLIKIKNCKENFFVKKPSKSDFNNSCNKFWWNSFSVLKGYFREQEIFAMEILETVLRPELMKMIDWYVGFKNDFKISTGKNHRNIQKFLTKQEYEKLIKTYPAANLKSIYKAYLAICDAFVYFSDEVAYLLGIDIYVVPTF